MSIFFTPSLNVALVQNPAQVIIFRTFAWDTLQQRLTFQFLNFTVSRLLRVSVSENLISKKSLGFKLVAKKMYRFQKIWSRKKSIGFGNLVSEKSLGIGQNFGIVIQCPVDGNVPSSMTQTSQAYNRNHDKDVLIEMEWFIVVKYVENQK